MEPIAIIGIGCRFPGAHGPDQFWRLLADGADATGEVPPDRWDVDALYDPDPTAPGRTNSRRGGFLHDIDRFDREFFGISPLEARAVDPQQRLLLEAGWEALEDAGQDVTALAGSDTGVFVGISSFDYALLQAPRPEQVDAYWGTGVALSVAANRISYLLDLHGPSIAVDTACSSSLVALHTACQCLWSGQSQLAIAGGVNAILSPSASVNFTKAGVMAPDGRCKTFDAAADGYVRGEGVGVVVLKPLGQALTDHDPVRAVIRGGAVGQDGRTSGLMAPNGRSQERLLRTAYQHSGVAPDDVDYVEAHGTGTFLGDVMEARALGRVVGGADRPAERPCVIGSVKSNLGHLEAAAGIAGVIKAALMLEHRWIPASLHVHNPNPEIDFAELGLRVARAAEPWRRDGSPARAGVSSFGFGGTGAHLVLEEAPVQAPPEPSAEHPAEGRAVLLALSARSPEALRQTAERHREMLDGAGSEAGSTGLPGLDGLAHTCGTRRAHHRHRLAVVTDTREGAVEGLRSFLADRPAPGLASGDAGRSGRRHGPVFVCSGQGPVWWPLDPALRQEPAFLAVLEECDRLIREEAGWSLLEQLWADEEASLLGEADFCQPALFAVQVALAGLWRAWGIVPEAVVGHSMGEVAAAHLSGALGLADAVRVVCRRGRAIRTVAGRGRMAVVELSAEALEAEIGGLADRLSVAALNAPTSAVISGDPKALTEAMDRLRAKGTFCRVLESVDFASHSPQMEPLTAQLAAALDGLRPAAGKLPMYSTVTGRRIDGSELDGGYWARNIRTPVLFAAAVDGLLADGHDAFVELSPHPGLLPAVAQNARARGPAQEPLLLPSLHRERAPRAALLGSLGALYATGSEPDWTGPYPGPRRPVRLPSYPWQRERCWLTPPTVPRPAGPGRGGGHPLLGPHLRLAGEDGHGDASHVWESTLGVTTPAFLGDHRVQGVAVLPGAAWLEMARAAARAAGGNGDGDGDGNASPEVLLTSVEFRRMLVLDDADGDGDAGGTTVQLRMSPEEGGGAKLRAYGRGAPSAWTTHMTATVRPGTPAQADAAPLPALDVDAVRARCRDPLGTEELYAALGARGLAYGPAFRAVERLWRGEREACAALVPPEEGETESGSYGIHPVLLDAALQVLGAALQDSTGDGTGDGTDAEDGRPLVPLSIERAALRPAGAGKQDRLWAHVRLRPEGGAVGDVVLADADGTVVADLQGVRAGRLDGDGWLPAAKALDRALYEVTWQPRERGSTHAAPAAGGWLVFADRGGVGTALAARLAADGERAVLVDSSAGHGGSDPERLTARPDDGDEVRRAVATARKRLGALRGVVHLWGLDADHDSLRAAQRHGAVSALHLIHALTADTPARLWLLTSGVQADVGGSASAWPVAHAPLWGLGRTAALEHPELRPTLVDLDPASGPAEAALWLAGELHADDTERQLAVRDGRRHAARLVRRPGPRSSSAAAGAAVRSDATYLVSGGLGALGLRTARLLVERGARHLLLLGRHGTGSGTEGDAALRALRAAGAGVRVARADVSDDGALAQVLADAAQSMPAIRGVVHAAGVLDDATLATLDPARLLAVLEPKVMGAWHLHGLTEGLPLDFFVLFSSLAGTLGSPGQANYAAANAFLDALAGWRAAQGRPALSIAWGPWDGTGLSVRPEGAGRLVEQAGVRGIAPDVGAAWLDRLLGTGAARLTVAPVDWRQWAASSPAAAASALTSELVPDDGPGGTSEGQGRVAAGQDGEPLTVDALFAADPADRPGLLESYLHGAIARALELAPERLDVEQPLTDVGLDSLVAVGMKNQIEVDLGMSLPLAEALEGSTVRQLAEQMLAEAGQGAGPGRDGGAEPDPDWEEFEIL